MLNNIGNNRWKGIVAKVHTQIGGILKEAHACVQGEGESEFLKFLRTCYADGPVIEIFQSKEKHKYFSPRLIALTQLNMALKCTKEVLDHMCQTRKLQPRTGGTIGVITPAFPSLLYPVDHLHFHDTAKYFH